MKNRFEFLGSTGLGQYIPRQSWLHRRDPRAKLVAFLMLFIGMVFSPGLWGILAGLLLTFLIYLLSRLPFKPTWTSILRAFPFILILAFLQILFTRSSTSAVLFTVFGLKIYQSSIVDAITLIVKFIALICLLNALVMCISTSQISAALFYLFKPLDKLKFPVNDLTMVTQITLRYIPIVAQITEKTAKAQAARGGDWERKGFNPIKQAKMILPLIVPVIIMSLKRAETMAVAMESRGFNAAEKRSSYYELIFNWQDAFLIGITIIISAMMILSGKYF